MAYSLYLLCVLQPDWESRRGAPPRLQRFVQFGSVLLEEGEKKLVFVSSCVFVLFLGADRRVLFLGADRRADAQVVWVRGHPDMRAHAQASR